jgi:hypothetical protein
MNTVAGTIQCCIPERTANHVVVQQLQHCSDAYVACITSLSLQLLSGAAYV